MGEFSQLKSPPNTTTIEHTKSTSAIEAAGEAAGKSAGLAALKASSILSHEGNMWNEPAPKNKSDAASSPNTMDNFFKGSVDAVKGIDGGAEGTKKLDKDVPNDATKNAPPDVMKAIQEEKDRMKSAVKAGAEAAASAAKHLPELKIE